MTKGWGCSRCDYTTGRHWNMNRHIKGEHDGLGQAVDLKKMRYKYGNRNAVFNQQPQQLQHSLNSASNSGFFPYYYFEHMNPYNNIQSRKENTKPYSTSNFIEKVFLEPLRQLREFKQLLDDICPIP